MTTAREPNRTGTYRYPVMTGVVVGLVVAVLAMVMFSVALALSGHHHIAGLIPLLVPLRL